MNVPSRTNAGATLSLLAAAALLVLGIALYPVAETSAYGLQPAAQPTLTVPGNSSLTFPETGKTVSGLFLEYWEGNGGLAQQGFPISDLSSEVSELDGKAYTVQYFERAVFEYHPDNQAPFKVLLSQLGTFCYRAKYPQGAPGQHPNLAGGRLFSETGHHVGGKFWDYWQANGGLAQQGYPISDEFSEVSDLDGKPYLVQYFERAVFELHPDNQPPYNVLLSQLGTFRYKARYAATPPTSPAPSPSAAPVQGLVDVGGYRLYYSCMGQGSPTVLMDAGLSITSSTWSRVQPSLAKFTRVCVYDRANLGRSERSTQPRTSMQIARELHALLTNAAIAGPYVLVGHSQGGLNMLMFAKQYRSEIVGMVAVDGAPPDITTRYKAVLSAEQFKQYQQLFSGNSEGVTYDVVVSSETQVQAAGPLPDVPFIILRHGIATQQLAGWPVAALEAAWQEAQEALARSTPQGKVIVAQRSGHFIQNDQPDQVINAISEVVDRAR